MAKSTIIIKEGKVLVASKSTSKARVFKSRWNAEKFARNMIRMANNLRFKDFEFITIG